MLNVLSELWPLALVALLYLVFDIYPVVKSFQAIFRTGSFWLFWIIFSILNTVAYEALNGAGGQRIKGLVTNPVLAHLAVMLLATLGTISIIQSFTLKVAEYKFVDFGKLVEGFRSQVLADISRVSADQERQRALAVADRIYQKYKNEPDALRNEYAGVMAFGNRTVEQIGQELTELKEEADKANLSFERTLARRIAQVDIKRAQQLV